MNKDQRHFDMFVDKLSAFFPPKEVWYVFEMGAKDSADTIRFHEHFPHAYIFTFECNADTLPICRQRVRGIDRIRLTEKAVSDTDGTITFYPIDTENTVTPHTDGNPGASSMFKASGRYPLEQYAQKETRVPSTRLDTFMREKRLPGIDVLWLDTQGAELKILRGLGAKLRTVRIIHTEVEFIDIYSGQPLFKDIKRFLARNDFAFVALSGNNKYFGDAVFVNKDVARPLVLWYKIFAMRFALLKKSIVSRLSHAFR